MPAFLRQSAHSVRECQCRAIVGERKATRQSPAVITEFPIGNLREIACAFARRKRTNSAPAGGASSIRKRRNHAVRPEQRRPDCPNMRRLGLNSNDATAWWN
jgi:hypothetical protein